MFTRLAVRAAGVGVLATLAIQMLPAADAATDADAPMFGGTTPYTAAGSCWEIKQRFPSAPSGRYWIVTPAMPAPQRIHCDQTTSGGGWELVARGRERWTEAGGGTPGSGSWMTDLPVDGSNGAMIAKQLPGAQIDALMNGRRVDDLDDGVRLRRAKNTSGTSWQELRFRYADRGRWSWAVAAKHRISSYSVDGVTTRKSQQVRDLRISGKDDSRRTFQYASSLNSYTRGFTYGASGPRGTTSATSYLYSSRKDRKYATPFTQMFIRPKLVRDDLDFASIPDSGKAAVTNRPIVSSQALPNTWGVKGLGAGGTTFNATEVSAFAQIGNVMYVGGNFTKVRNNVTGVEYAQPYLAAFDATSGAWISGFRPKLDNQVKALTEYRGRLVVGGQFTAVNGVSRKALVQLDASTGETASGFRTTFSQSTAGATLWVRSVVVKGDWLYVGGGFTGVAGGTSTTPKPLRNIARMDGSTGAPDLSWTPNLGLGLVQPDGKRTSRSSVLSLDLSPDGSTLYAAGQFTAGYVSTPGRSQVAAPGAAAIGAESGTLRTWRPTYSSKVTRTHYQQAVKAVGDRVWLGGSQHSMVEYDASDLSFVRGNLTLAGGDMQAIDDGGGVVYGSCHCNDWNYSGTMDYDDGRVSGFTQADRIGYVGAWDARTGDYLPQFAPTSGTRSGEGPFALKVASNGALWSGGDYTSIVTTNNKSEWAGGFVRFARTPSTAPAAPGNLTVRRAAGSDYAYLGWSASSTPGVSYELLEGDRVVQTMAPGDLYSDRENYDLGSTARRFFVRAVDAAGNRSATTPVTRVGGDGAARQAPEQAESILLPSGSTWTVTAPGSDGVDPQWSQRAFVPGTGWGDATAPIGWGTGAAASTFDDRPGTFYLRRDVTIADPATVGTVTIHTVADDGAAIYVNGVEVGRANLPAGALDGGVSATATPEGSDSLDWVITVPADLLVAGRNVIAAEVHPGSADTKDVVFDLEVSARP